jgi:chorismate lyase / 3-hydroxybenzoate synthase
MQKISHQHVSAVSPADRATDLAAPAWARELPADRFTLHTARVSGAADLAPPEFERRTFETYAAVADQLARGPHRHALRFWNHVPFITEPADAGRDNYMVFNAGRFRAFSAWYGEPAQFERHVATASAIGHRGHDLVVHCLAGDEPGAAVNNPRQVAPYHYSQRFGPLPPCFARATLLAGRKLLVGGTASVRGEDSFHTDDLAAQLSETFVNIAALVCNAAGKKLTPSLKLSRVLSSFRELRVYHPQQGHAAEIERAVASSFPNLRRLEMSHADLCRPELLVEIEGVAEIAPPAAPAAPANES